MQRPMRKLVLATLGLLALVIVLLMMLVVQLTPSAAHSAPTPMQTAYALVSEFHGTETPSAPSDIRPEHNQLGASDSSLQVGQDLMIQSITLDPPNPDPGEPVNITVVVQNVGTIAVADGFYTFLYIDPLQRPPTTMTPDTSYIGWFLGLNAGATFTWSYTDYVFETAGCDHVVYAWVDRDDVVAEDDETNNLAHVDVCVGGTDLDPYEPDDNECTSATVLLTDGIAQAHTFSPVGDQDWVQFTGVGGAEYLIVAHNVGANADAALSLFSRCGLPASFGGSQQIRVTLPTSGVYYVKAVNHNSGATSETDYEISITSPFDCSGYHEPNDTRAMAVDIPSYGSTQLHSFCAPNDEDWIKFTVEAGASYTVQATTIGSQAVPTLTGSYGLDPEDAQVGNPIQFVASTNDTYYVRAMNSPSTVYGPTTEYTLAVNSQTCSGDTFEPDNARTEARTMVVNGNAETRNACPAADRDWIKFTAAAGMTYTLETVGTGDASDTILCLYDNLGTTIACDDEGGGNHGSRLTWQATAGGEYFAEVRQADEQAAGPSTAYELSVATGLCKPDLYEPDNTASNAGVLPADGSRQLRNFCASDDRDWVRLSVPAAGAHTIETIAQAPNSDTYLSLYDDDRTSLLVTNDDYGPGLASRIAYNFTRPGTYYLEVRHFNPARYGRSTSYLIAATAGTPTPTPPPGTVTPTPTPEPTATPPPSGIRTLILTNGNQLTAIYGAERADALLDKLAALAVHPAVHGEIIQVEGNETAGAAYMAWMADPTSVVKANQTTAAIRGIVMEYLAAHPSLQYIVLVGDDRVVPARRVRDRTSYSEREYTTINATTTVGAALAQDYFLTDDYYADREPSDWEGAELYIPDLAIGRLVETPEEIGGLIDAFLSSDYLPAGRELVTGYDFVQDVAANICELFGQDFGNANLDCTLIGSTWTSTQLRAKQLNSTPPFKLQSINGHASHAGEGAPAGSPISARDVVSGTSDLSGGLIYSPGCHSGLNVPETSDFALDLPQAFTRKQAHYVGNTGFGWGSRMGVRLSERMVQNFTQELLKTTAAAIGKALAAAKQRYYQEADLFEETDEKVLQEMTLYGLPMYQMVTGNVFGDDDPFPSVVITSTLGGMIGPEGDSPQAGSQSAAPQTGMATLGIRVTGVTSGGPSVTAGQGYDLVSTAWGDYYELDGHINSQPDGPIQPQVYARLAPPQGQRLRGLVFTAGEYVTNTIDPVIDLATNEYAAAPEEPQFQSAGFYPPVPFTLWGTDTISRTQSVVTVVMGQYDSASGVQRLYDRVLYDVYFSESTDQTGPTIASIDGYYNIRAQQATFKVEANDPITVTRVLIAYTTGVGSWFSFDLTYSPPTHKWMGALPGVRGAAYFVQAVDSAGNVTAVTRKGGYFGLDEVALETEQQRVHLPLVLRQQ